jgi:hypothetical protein
MFGIVTVLEPSDAVKVQSVWKALEAECGLVGIKATPIPHFSWQVSENYDWLKLEPILVELAQKTAAFQVRTAGIGVFTGSNPIIYLALVKEANFLHIHQWLCDHVSLAGMNFNPYYLPTAWMPHITLAYADVDHEKIKCAIDYLGFIDFEWDLLVSNFALVGQPQGFIDLKSHIIPFQG